MAPDSRRSESWGAALVAFGARVSWLRTRTGICRLLGESLLGPREDAGDFFLAIAEAVHARDQLQVIHDQEGKAFVALEAAGLCADFETEMEPASSTRWGRRRWCRGLRSCGASSSRGERPVRNCERRSGRQRRRGAGGGELLGHFEG